MINRWKTEMDKISAEVERMIKQPTEYEDK